MKLRSLSAGLACCLLATPALADINYGDFSGIDFDFIGVTESSPSGDDLPLFGAPSVNGNTLDFDPMFSAFSEDGGVDLTDGQLNFQVCAHDGAAIDSLIFNESGDFSLAGTGTDATWVSVEASFFVEIIEIDGIAVSDINSNFNMTFTPTAANDGEWDLDNFPGLGTIWEGEVVVDIAQMLADLDIDGNATKVNISLDNTLVAQSEDGTVALIAKKEFDGLGITVIPAPGAMALLAVAGLAGRSRRRRI